MPGCAVARQREDQGLSQGQPEPGYHADKDRKVPRIADSQMSKHGSTQISRHQNRSEKRGAGQEINERHGDFHDSDRWQER